MNKFVLLSLLLLGLAGCYTSKSDPDYASRANSGFIAKERDSELPSGGSEMRQRISRLWADRNDYIALLQEPGKPECFPRLVSSVPPTYPTLPLLANVRAKVVMSFVVDENGKVEAARVLESSDSRFDQAALESVLKWKFLPALSGGKPNKCFITTPIEFAGIRKE